MEGLIFIFALVYLVFLVYLLAKFIQLCNDTRDIKNLLVSNFDLKQSKSSSSEDLHFKEAKFKKGDLVVEKITNKQLRLGNFYDGLWTCISNGQEYKELKEDDLYTWEEYLASIGKK